MGSDKQFFIAYHAVVLVISAIAFAYASMTVSKLRHVSVAFNAWLLAFAYFSLSSWILWALQYLISLANSFNYFHADLFQKTGLCLGGMQIVLWASSVWALRSKQFPKMSLTLSLWIMCSIVIVLATYPPTVITPQSLAYIEAVSSTAVFLIFAYEIVQMRHSVLFALWFFVHGYFQWIWNALWIKPAEAQIELIVFPLWHIALLGAWIALISEMLITFRVMISSTVKDLEHERSAAANAVRSLQLDSFRAETFGSLPGTPEAICASLAEKCDIFILIIGERFGYIIRSRGISAVEFEYEIAHAQNPEKILVYVKDGVKRESRLEEFLARLQDFEHGHFRSLFTTPEDLYQKIQHDIAGWLTSRAKQKPKGQ